MPEEIKNEEKKTKKERKDEKKEKEYQTLLAEKEREVEEWKNKYYMAYADTENLRKQYDKEHQQILKYRSMGFLEKLLPILDGFHMALSNEVEDPTLKNYLTGFQYIYKMMVDALESEGVTEICPSVGDPFNETTMDAMDTEESEGEENRVVRVFQKGYKLKDRMIRHARVVVSKHPSSPQQEEENEEDQSEPKMAA